jgi:hypothetical protein
MFIDDFIETLQKCGHIPSNKKKYWNEIIDKRSILQDHYQTKERQRKSFNQAIIDVSDDELILLIDFKQNIELGHGPVENQDVWRTRVQNTVLGIICWSGKTGKVFVDFVSNTLSHTAEVAIDCLKDLFKKPWLGFQDFNTVKIWSDCGPHFRCAQFANFILRDLVQIGKCDAELNFFAERHGKGEVDSHFSRISLWLKQTEYNQSINSTQEAIQAIIQGHKRSNDFRTNQSHRTPTQLHVYQYSPEETTELQISQNLHLEVMICSSNLPPPCNCRVICKIKRQKNSYFLVTFPIEYQNFSGRAKGETGKD